MNASARILGLIPARGNSKGIPGKNLRPVAGKPLLVHTLTAARASRLLTDIVVSSEDDVIRRLARRNGVRAPFRRPAELSRDEVLMPPVAVHALQWLADNEGREYDYLFLLLPTAPLRTAEDIDSAARLMLGHPEAGSVLAVTRVEDPHPWKMKVIVNGRLAPMLDPDGANTALRRQDCPPVYAPCGCATITRPGSLMKSGQLLADPVLPYIMPPERAVNIDTLLDLELAEHLLSKRRTAVRTA